MTDIAGADMALLQTGSPRAREAAWKLSSTSAYIRIEGVSKKFGEFTAVNEVTLDIFRGRSFVCWAARVAARPHC